MDSESSVIIYFVDSTDSLGPAPEMLALSRADTDRDWSLPRHATYGASRNRFLYMLDLRIPCVRPGIVIDNRSSWCFRKSVGGSRPDKKIID